MVNADHIISCLFAGIMPSAWVEGCSKKELYKPDYFIFIQMSLGMPEGRAFRWTKNSSEKQ